MRNYIVCVLCFLAASTYGQPQLTPFKGANQITVTTGMTADSLFTFFGTTLLDSGYTIEGSDVKFRTIKAKKVSPGGYSYDMVINARVKDSLLLLVGTSYNGGYSFEIEFRKGGGVPNAAFKWMERIAHAVPGKITYEKK